MVLTCIMYMIKSNHQLMETTMTKPLTQAQIQGLANDQLSAIDRSTNPSGRYWMQLAWARTEMARRKASPS